HQSRRIVDVIEILSDPVECLQVAQSAFAFLDVGLDEVPALALAAMTLAAFGKLGLDKVLAAARRNLTPEFSPQFFVELFIGPQIAGFEDGGADGAVLFGQPHAFAQGARGMAYLQPKIPEHVEDELDDAFAPGRLLERAHEEKVDVRSGCKLAAAITAGRDDGNSLGVRRILRVVEVFGGEMVDHLD